MKSSQPVIQSAQKYLVCKKISNKKNSEIRKKEKKTKKKFYAFFCALYHVATGVMTTPTLQLSLHLMSFLIFFYDLL